MRKKIMTSVIAASLMISSVSVTWPAQVEAERAEITYGVNFRTSPSVTDNKIRMLKKGENVTILKKANEHWYQVRDRNGKVGYISTDDKYTNVTGQVEESYTGTIVWGVSFRTGPSTSYKRTRYLQKGEVVTIIEEVNSYWYKVRDRNGTVGYISSSSQYIDVGGGNSQPIPPASGGGSSNASTTAKKVINAGKNYLGTPYEFGSNRHSTATFDCSDFVRRAFLDATDVTLPMDSRKQAEYVKKKGNTTTNWKNLKPGDLLFYMDYKGTSKSHYTGIDKSKQRISHVSIYLGDGKVLHTYSKTSGGVRIDSIEGKHWEYRFVFGGSAL